MGVLHLIAAFILWKFVHPEIPSEGPSATEEFLEDFATGDKESIKTAREEVKAIDDKITK